ncbi:DUF3466 family protein [Shewanella algae]|uniref:DUF3466 family protein n=2 Tax=Unclassified Bacteria TaxID=49928 RepID=A0AAU6VKN6_UNCXX|nr:MULTISPECIES: DUF3466 family protein [Shewanella]MBO2620215.1 DUF3466 family protein [Shewanella algae]MCT8979117.1 DUF3466 family protein [Shewanella algae]MDE0565525.1 DUF3466 family protein [Shewanella sp. K8]TVK91017.1 hypothetical protein AYI83_20915 [Shewanella algae]TVK95590.1 hypothetical protein AYJ01_02175 [Shewanella algae]
MKLNSALSLVAMGVISVLQVSQAAPVYEVVNLDEYDLKGNLTDTRTGYGMGVNANNEAIGVAKGKKKLSTSDVDNDDGIIDIEDGIAPEEKITYSINDPIIANNFTFNSQENDPASPWTPNFESVNGSTPPADTDPADPASVNSVDSFFYDVNDAGIRVGAMTGKEKKVDYTGETEGQEYWYYRDFEQRGFVKDGSTEVPLLPPYTTYTKDDKTAELGGWSMASAINSNNLVAGYASTAISNYGAERAAACLSDDNTLPLDVCLQREKYPNANNTRNIQYQMRAYVWQYDNGAVTGTELPLGLTPGDSDYTFTAQGLGLNNTGVVAGRSHVYRYNDSDNLRMDAAYWSKDANGEYKYHWIPVVDDDVRNSIAYDVNDAGILVGSYNKYIQGYIRDKFFIYDTNNPETKPVTPNDFYNTMSDLSSKPRDINNKGQVVGYIESTHDKDKPRPKVGFLFDKESGEFSNLNKLLTCESKGYEKDAEGNWKRHEVSVEDGSGKTLTYNTDIVVVEANSINEEGTIVGTAFIRKPSYQFDEKGNLVIGENGKPLFELNGNGQPVTSYLPRMVVLKPSGSGEACTQVDDGDIDKPFERSGAASLGWLALLPLIWWRRRKI